MKSTWKEKYSEIKPLTNGGQGQIYKVFNGEDKKIPFALKVWNRQRDYRQRSRIKKEISNLKKLGSAYHPNIVQFIEANEDDYDKLDIELYMVTAFIEGKELPDVTTNLDSAISITEKLIDGIGLCHDKGIIHRDIKPRNIIVHEDGNPILIDFGISFDQEEVSELTGASEGLGNRFLQLPELKIIHGKADDKRDIRSDLCSCVGILFFLLTKEEPGQLIDQNNKMPHQRDSAKEKLKAITKEKLQAFNQIFDRGFKPDISARFQNYSQLAEALAHANSFVPPAQGTQSLSEILKSLRESASGQELVLMKNALDAIQGSLIDAWSITSRIHADDLICSQSDGHHTPDSYSLYLEFRAVLKPEAFFKAKFVSRIVGSEAVLVASLDGNIEEIFRADYKNVKRGDDVFNPIREYIDRQLVDRLTNFSQ